ncbi:MAG: glycosyltransferase [Oscillospiraceae bacterium]|jgi:glycosyltransferase involved in cell wall biosynthesis|nr:glycosyltransferase [Oscillospiraceae bacterium]
MSKTDAQKCAILIPAYKPEGHFAELVRELVTRGGDVYVVDDGSGEAFANRFGEAKRLGAVVLRHDVNQGKGRAIKTGISAIAAHGDKYIGIVTADADGQHCADDIEKIGAAIASNPRGLVIGVRAFDRDVPLRNFMGNTLTRLVYALSSRIVCSDTQTGLRGFPRALWQPLLEIEGERYEYEMNMLIRVRELGSYLAEVPIQTIYIDNNSASHFDKVNDSAKIYGDIIRLSAHKLISFCVDFFVFSMMLSLSFPAYGAYAIARIFSLLPYLAAYMFAKKKSAKLSSFLFPTGFADWVLILITGGGVLEVISLLLGITGWWLKLIIDGLLFLTLLKRRKKLRTE